MATVSHVLAQSPTKEVTMPVSSTQEIQTYIQKKNHLRSKEKRAALARAQAEMAARKEKLQVLEKERRARLRFEALNGKERVEIFSRPQWDSSVSASTGEINGPWSRSCHPVTPINFPLPKPIDEDTLSSVGLASKSSCESFYDSLQRSGKVQETSCITDCNLLEDVCLHAESSQEKMNMANINHHIMSSNKSPCQQEVKVFTNPKVCSGHNVKSRSFLPVQSLKTGTKEMRSSPSNRITNSFKQQHRELAAAQALRKTCFKYIPKYTLFQQAYDTESSTPLSYCGDRTTKNTFPSNKRKALAYTFTNQELKSVEKKLKMHAKANGLNDRRHMATPINTCHDAMHDVRESMPCHTQYLTYHLEKFPSKYKREALTEKKRVALLKVLAQQLVVRLDAAESHPSYLLDGSVQSHALSLRNNLEKFQKELLVAVKALEAFYSQPSRTKSSGYIVLPSKLERKRNFQFDKGLMACSQVAGAGPDLCQKEEALNNQDVLFYHELSSETATSATSILTDSSILQEAEKNRQRNGDSFKGVVLLGSCKESNGEIEAKTPDNMFLELKSRLQSVCVDFKSEALFKEQRTWDHHLLNRELEKLDAEIKETKMRMAQKLISAHPIADIGGMNSPLSQSPRCNGEATPHLGIWSASPTVVNGTERSMEFCNLAEEKSSNTYHAQNEHMGVFSGEKGLSSILEASSFQVNEKDVQDDVNSKDETDNIGTGEPVEIEQISNEVKGGTIVSSKSFETSARDVNMKACEAHHQVRRVEISQVAPEATGGVDLIVLFKKGINADQGLLADAITKALMQELLDSELSDMMLHRQDVSCPSELKRMKKEVLEHATQKSVSLYGASRVQHLADAPRSPCASVSSSPVPIEEVSDICGTGSLVASDGFDPWNYQNYSDPETMTKSTSPVNDIVEIYREPFKVTSKRLVEKYVKEILDAQGLLSAWSLLGLYASDETLTLTLEKQSVEERDFEEKLYGKMVLEALCECLDKKFLRFYLPSFFLLLQPCPADLYLKQTLENTVNEHADAACEGGFSLEYILEKSLEEEDWKSAHQEMVEVIHDISEYVMMDMIKNIVQVLMVMKPTTCFIQV